MKRTVFFFAAAALLLSTQVQASETIEAETVMETVEAPKVSPFCMAVVKGDLEAVKKMVEEGTDVNQKSNGMTALHYAARYNRAEILEYLLENGASISIRSSSGLNAYDFARASGAEDALSVLERS